MASASGVTEVEVEQAWQRLATAHAHALVLGEGNARLRILTQSPPS